MSDNLFWFLIVVVCFFSCEGCPGRRVIDHYIDTHPCVESTK